MVQCDLGQIEDLSRGGMRLAGRGKAPLSKGQVVQIALRCPQGTINVTGRAVRVRRRGWRDFEIGIQFVNLKKPVAAAIESLAQFGFITGRASGSTSESEPGKSKTTVRIAADMPDYYKILGIAPQASTEDVQAAYRQLARRYHPDVSQDAGSQEKFLKIKHAYEVLKDPDRRRLFDEYLAA